MKGLVLVLFLTGVYSISCRDMVGESVDWWIAYKAPILSASKNPKLLAGYGFAYMDDYTPFQLSDLTLDQAEDMLKHTLAVLYTKEAARGVPTNRSTDSNSTAEIVPGVDGFHTMASTVGHLMYNDQWPSGKTCSACGHTKGVLGFDVNGGFWLVHSTPRFPLEPSIEAFYSFPANERIYGQSYLCITLPF